jgi:hypothetical protein
MQRIALKPIPRVVKITHYVALSFHPILDVGFGIADLLYRFAQSFFIKLIRRRRTLNPNSKIRNPKFMINKGGSTYLK